MERQQQHERREEGEGRRRRGRGEREREKGREEGRRREGSMSVSEGADGLVHQLLPDCLVGCLVSPRAGNQFSLSVELGGGLIALDEIFR